MIDEAKKAGPAVILDAGNALFRAPGMTDEDSKKRATFILSTMGKLGTQAMAVGTRDLDLGADWLKEQGAKSKVLLLSANLAGKDGKLIFAPSTLLTAGGVKLGVIGVSPPVEVDAKSGVKGGPVPAAVIAEAKKLRPKVDLVIVLAAVPYADALQIANEAKDSVDFVIQSHDARGAGMAQRNESVYVVPGGERGRQVAKLSLGLDGKGPFIDLDEATREKQMVDILTGQMADLKKRFDVTTDPKAKADLKAAMDNFEISKKQHEARAVLPGKGARTLKLEWVNLGPDRPDDPTLRAEVEKIEPPGTAQH